MPNTIILHAWYSKPEDNWYPWIKSEAEKKGYLADIPKLPTMDGDAPDLQLMLDYLFNNFKIDKDTTLIGHSLGSLLAMRVAEQKQVAKIILVSGWDFNDLTVAHQSFWKTPTDHAKIIENTEKIVCISTVNDPYFTACTCEEMAERFKGEVLILPKGGHLGSKDKVTEISELLQFI